MIEQKEIDFTAHLGKIVNFLEVTKHFTPFHLYRALGFSPDEISIYDVAGLVTILEDEGMVKLLPSPSEVVREDGDTIYIMQYQSLLWPEVE